MGTRGLVRVFDGEDEILCLYRQFDCYPSGLGAELRAFIASKSFVNGISGDASTLANGAGCFAAQLVVHLKDGQETAGSVYVYPPGAKGCGEEYEYHVLCPTLEDRDRERGLRAKLKGFSVSGGYDGEPRKLEPVTAEEYRR